MPPIAPPEARAPVVGAPRSDAMEVVGVGDALAPSAAAPQGPVFRLQTVEITPVGPETLPKAALAAMARPLIGEVVALADLEALRRAMTERIVAAGFVSSGALLTEIDAVTGVARFEVIGGRVSDIRVAFRDEGPAPRAPMTADYVRGRMALPADEAVRLNRIEAALRVLLTDPGVKSVAAALRPDLRRGEAILDLEVTTRRAVEIAVGIDNATPASIGETTGVISGVLRGLTGGGDTTGFEARLSEGRRSLLLEADLPLRPGGLSLFAVGEIVDADVIEAPFDDLALRSTFARLGVGLAAPLLRTPRRSLDLMVGFEAVDTRSELLDEPFSFAEGVDDGETRIRALTLSQAFVARGDAATVALRGALRVGLPVLGATDVGGEAPDASFVAALLQGQVAARLAQGVVAVARVQGQFASDALLPVEKVSIGGRNTVRGYRESALVADQAALASLEARLDLLDLPAPGLSPPDHEATVTLIPFVDVGAAWEKGRLADRRTLLGVGAGIAWSPAPGVSAELFYGAALRDAPAGAGGDTLQDEGVHFAITVALP